MWTEATTSGSIWARLSGASAVALMLLSIAPAVGLAAVHVDPEGPAGKQYSDTLDEARVDNGGGDPAAAVPGSTAKAPLFGEGIARSDAQDPQPSEKKAADDAQGAESKAASSTPAAKSGGGDSASGLIAAILAGVVLVGALAGFGIRRLGRPPPV